MLAMTACVTVSCAAEPRGNAPGAAGGTTRAGLTPLTLPPNYTLHPSEQGEETLDDRTVAKRILGQSWSRVRGDNRRQDLAEAASLSAEEVLRRKLRLDEALPEIRQLLAEEAGSSLLGENYPLEALLCWPREPAADGCRDHDRPQERASMDSVDAGTPAPQIERPDGIGDILF